MRALFRNCLLVLLGAVIGAALDSGAQPYVGASIGLSRGVMPASSDCWECSSQTKDYTTSVYKIVGGYRWDHVSLEGSLGTFAHYSSHAVVASRPADVQQDIQTDALALKLKGFIPLTRNIEGFVSYGVARLYMRNYERGINTSYVWYGSYVEQKNSNIEHRPIGGFGLQYNIGRWAIVGEVERVLRFARSGWTNSSNATVGWLAVTAKF